MSVLIASSRPKLWPLRDPGWTYLAVVLVSSPKA
jgi:hypothetical protein